LIAQNLILVPYKFLGYRPKISWKICNFWGIC